MTNLATNIKMEKKKLGFRNMQEKLENKCVSCLEIDLISNGYEIHMACKEFFLREYDTEKI